MQGVIHLAMRKELSVLGHRDKKNGYLTRRILHLFCFSFYSHNENRAKPKRKALSPQRLFSRRSKHKYMLVYKCFIHKRNVINVSNIKVVSKTKVRGSEGLLLAN